MDLRDRGCKDGRMMKLTQYRAKWRSLIFEGVEY